MPEKIYSDKSRAVPKVGQWTHYPTRLAVLFLLAVVVTIALTLLMDTTPGAAVIIGLVAGAAAGVGASWEWMRHVMNEPVDPVDITEEAAVITDSQERKTT